MSEAAFVAINTTFFFRLVVRTHGKTPKLTQRVITIFVSTQNLTSPVRILLFVAFCSVSLFCLRTGCGRRRSPLSSLTTALVSRGWRVMTETARISFGTLSLRLPLKTLPLSSQRRLCFLCDSWQLIPFPQISISRQLINKKFHCSFQLLIVRCPIVSSNFLIRQGHNSLTFCGMLQLGLKAFQ